MQQSKSMTIIWTALAGLLIVACTGTEIGNPQDDEESEVSVQVQGLDRGTSGALTLTNGIEFEEAWLVLEDVEFRSGQECEETIATDFDAINAVELISGTEYPGYDMTLLPASSYCRFAIQLDEVELDDLPSGAPEELAGLSILVRGKSPAGIPFEVRYDDSERLEFHGRFTLAPPAQSLFTVFALNEWLTPEQLQKADDGTSDTIVIDDDTNTDLLEDFLAALQTSGILVRDENDDGILQDSELDFPLARGDALLIGDD